jgi:hypothetical protein
MKIKTTTKAVTKTIIEVASEEFYMNFTEAVVAESIDDQTGAKFVDALITCSKIVQGDATSSEVKQFFLNRYTFMALPNVGGFLDSYTGSLDDVELHITFSEAHKRGSYIIPGRYLNF